MTLSIWFVVLLFVGVVEVLNVVREALVRHRHRKTTANLFRARPFWRVCKIKPFWME